MKDLTIYMKGNKAIKLSDLPRDLQQKIRNSAVASILIDDEKQKIKAGIVDMNKYIDMWLAGKTPQTAKNYRQDITLFRNYLDREGLHPLLVRAEHVDAWLQELKQQYSDNSVRKIVSGISSFYTLLRRYQKIAVNPVMGCPLPAKTYKKRITPESEYCSPVMTKDDIAIMQAELVSRLNIGMYPMCWDKEKEQGARKLLPIIHFLAEYGLRLSEIPTIYYNDKILSVVGKGHKSRKFAMRDCTIEIIKQYKLSKYFLKNMKTNTIQSAIKRLTKYLFRKKMIQYSFTTHDFRHFAAIREYISTRDIYHVMRFLGHSNPTTTTVYLSGLGIDL